MSCASQSMLERACRQESRLNPSPGMLRLWGSWLRRGFVCLSYDYSFSSYLIDSNIWIYPHSWFSVDESNRRRVFAFLTALFGALLTAVPAWKEVTDLVHNGQETFPLLTSPCPRSFTPWLRTETISLPILLAACSREKQMEVEVVLFSFPPTVSLETDKPFVLILQPCQQ